MCYVAATCSFFHSCAMDPLCFADIDLATLVPKVNNAVVSTMINRAGGYLRWDFFSFLYIAIDLLSFPSQLCYDCVCIRTVK